MKIIIKTIMKIIILIKNKDIDISWKRTQLNGVCIFGL